ncbi:MAG: hypothetical protein HKN09_08905 [Saprospiraceae bacterium]|nr:hypothetical protein [Saprospiraceae bacterium]
MKTEAHAPAQYQFPYKLSNVETVWSLENELIEISGLSFCSSDSSIWAINDEKGLAYKLNSENGKIVTRKKFASIGDYEGIECIDDRLFVVKSNGDVYTLYNDDRNAEISKTELSSANDIEGLAYDKTTHSLILACKGSPALRDHPKKKNRKATYAFDLKKNELGDKAYFEIHDSMLLNFISNQNSLMGLGSSAIKKHKDRVKSFSPSAIAVHPYDDTYYILSSVGKLLVVYDKESGLKHIEFLDKNIHYQPEGICFNNEGNMLIANEGKGLIAKVHVFKMKERS